MKCYFSKVRITVKRIARSHKHAVALIIIFGVTSGVCTLLGVPLS